MIDHFLYCPVPSSKMFLVFSVKKSSEYKSYLETINFKFLSIIKPLLHTFMFILYTSSVLFYNNNFIAHCYNFWIQQYLHTWTYWFVSISDKSISTQQIRWLYIFCCICIQILLNRCFLSIKYLPQIPKTSLLPLELCVAKIDTNVTL